MYTNYPHDSDAQHVDTAQRAVEGDQTHIRIQRGSITMNLTANTTTTNNVTFNPIFSPSPSSAPTVYLTLSSLGTMSSKINIVAPSANITNTGFQIEAYTDTTQPITVEWLAIGKAE